MRDKNRLWTPALSEHPDHVIRTDQTIVAWPNVPVAIQKKILSGTMTEEDWISDWEELSAVEATNRTLEDVVSSMLNATPTPVARHVHVFRKEYPKCMLKGCGALRSHHSG